MRIIVFGGAGDVGSRAVEELAAAPDVELVTIADRNQRAADQLAARLQGRPAAVRAVAVDALDRAAVVAAMRGHTLATSALGPFFRFEALLVNAALTAGLDYASVCDEWDATRATIAAFDERARAMGRVVLTGLGTSPGMTNVGVRLLAGQLDTVEHVEISVYQPLDAGGGEAVIRHMLHIMTGDVAAWRDGHEVSVRACSEHRTVEFPQFGAVRLWNMGHAEPVTVPRSFPAIRDVSFFMGYGRGAAAFVVPARLGVFRSRRLTELFVRGLLALERRTRAARPAAGAVRIDVWGTRAGAPTHRMACGVGQMREATGVGLAVGALMLGRGQLDGAGARGGVVAPEACVDPARFLAEMGARGLVAYEDLAMRRPLGAPAHAAA